MTSSQPQTRVGRLALPGTLSGITLLVLICFVVPFFGWMLSLAIPFATQAARRHLWRHASSAASSAWSWVAWSGLWWPGVLSIFAPFDGSEGEGGGMVISTIWLVMPLCGPAGLGPVLLPAVAAALTSLLGLLAATATQRVWPWVAALWVAPWVHHAAFSLMDPVIVC